MSEHDYKLVALDIDGTVLDSDSNVSSELRELLAELARTGDVHVALCTGRRWRSSKPVFDQLDGLSTYVICCGGALIKETDSARTVYMNPLGDHTARRAAELYRHHDLVPLFCYDRPLDEKELMVSEVDRDRAEKLRYVRRNRDDIEFFDGDYPDTNERCLQIYTVDFMSNLQGCEEDIRAELDEDGSIRGMIQPRYGEDHIALEVHHATATKWTGLQHLMEMWNVRPEQVVAVGDDVNDIPMLEAAGLSFAMGNAGDEVKDAADRLTTSNDDHGAAAALREVFAGPPAREAE